MIKPFRDFMTEKEKGKGLYVALLPSEKSRAAVFKFCKDLGLPNLVAENELHMTVVYSRAHVVDQSTDRFPMPVYANPKGWEILGEEKKVLTLSLYCTGAAAIHKTFRARGASHDFPSFKPHMTVALDWGGKELPKSLFPSKIIFDHFEVKPLDLDYQPKKDSEK